MKNCKAAIIIVTWNGKEFIDKCLSAVLDQTHDNYDVYCVDNGSTDGSDALIRTKFEKVKLLSLNNNYGFAKGNNEGIKEALKDTEVRYLVCLNNDTIVEKDWLSELIVTAEKDNNIGAVGSMSLYPDKTIQTAGIKLLRSKTFCENKPGDMSLGHFGSPEDFNREFKIFAPSAVSALYTRKALEDVGLFDEDLFSYCEDIDMGFRLREKGYTAYCNPFSRLTHFHSGTLGIASPIKTFYSKRNGFLVAVKNFKLKDMLLYPFKDLLWNIKQLCKKNKSESVDKVTKRLGFIGTLLLMTKIYISGLYLLPKFLIKRFKHIKQ